MKQIFSTALLILLTVWLAGCAYTQSRFLNTDLATESWRKDIDTSPNKWTKGSSHWFLTGDPNLTEIQNRQAPYGKSISTMQVRVPDFTTIVMNGDFQLQVFGTYDENSVYVYGPNEEVRQTSVRVKGNTLYLDQSKDVKCNTRNVIIRVGVGTLRKLRQLGNGRIEIIQLLSNNLTIESAGKGNIYLSGNVNLRRVDSTGSGSVTVFGANTPELLINTSGSGSVNVSGNVGIQCIVHHGSGNVNIIGANSDSLKIEADGSGKVGLSGIVNLREVRARDHVSVLVDCVNGKTLYVYSMEKARVGLIGNVRDLYINAAGVSNVYARYLYSQNAYVRVDDGAHVNVTATNKIFASATHNGSIYFFGDSALMSQFVSGNGVIIPVLGDKPRYPARMTARYKDDAFATTTTTTTRTTATSYSYKTPYKYKWVNGKLVSYHDGKVVNADVMKA